MKNLNLSGKRLTIGVFETAKENHEEVDESSDTEQTAGDQPKQTGADFADIEPMESEISKEEAQQQRNKFRFLHFFLHFHEKSNCTISTKY